MLLQVIVSTFGGQKPVTVNFATTQFQTRLPRWIDVKEQLAAKMNIPVHFQKLTTAGGKILHDADPLLQPGEIITTQDREGRVVIHPPEHPTCAKLSLSLKGGSVGVSSRAATPATPAQHRAWTPSPSPVAYRDSYFARVSGTKRLRDDEVDLAETSMISVLDSNPIIFEQTAHYGDIPYDCSLARADLRNTAGSESERPLVDGLYFNNTAPVAYQCQQSLPVGYPDALIGLQRDSGTEMDIDGDAIECEREVDNLLFETRARPRKKGRIED